MTPRSSNPAQDPNPAPQEPSAPRPPHPHGSAGSELWIFGYGSLVWRPDFAYAEREPAYVVGWARRFWQGSTDHRGVPGAPGRVVTMVPDPESLCWGMAYRIEATRVNAVLAQLDVREQGGYRRLALALTLPRSGRTVPDGLIYVATPDNRNYLGPAPLDEMAAQIRGSRGPSGRNADYVLELAAAIEAMGGEDRHLSELAGRLAPSKRERDREGEQ